VQENPEPVKQKKKNEKKLYWLPVFFFLLHLQTGFLIECGYIAKSGKAEARKKWMDHG
jgi:hypothetical protein